MPRNLRIALGILAVAVLIGIISLRGLHKRIEHLSELQSTDDQARRELLKPAISTPTDEKASAKIYWAADAEIPSVAPVEVDLPLSADPALRAKQVLEALITSPPSPKQRTLPTATVLLSLYVLPDGTAIADFSDALASEIPSGIQSENLAIESITQTLKSNVPSLRRLKILVHGQEVETLAGHADLTGFFDLNSAAPVAPVVGQTPAATIPSPPLPPSRPTQATAN